MSPRYDNHQKFDLTFLPDCQRHGVLVKQEGHPPRPGANPIKTFFLSSSSLTAWPIMLECLPLASLFWPNQVFVSKE